MKKENKKENQKEFEKSESDMQAPEILENKTSRPKTTPDVNNIQKKLDMIRKGELGAKDIGYNDDGSPRGGSRKVNLDTETDLK